MPPVLHLGAHILGEAVITAYTAYISIKGKKQGQFAGDASSKQNKDRILITSFSFSAESPPRRRQRSGERQATVSADRHPEALGGSQPSGLRGSRHQRDLAPSVLIEFITTDPKGTEVVDHPFSLTSATISAFREFTQSAQAVNQVDELKEISFTFQEMEIKDKSGKTFVDDWVA